MFITVNDIIINLKNVSNINIVKDKLRIIFNMNFYIQLPDIAENYNRSTHKKKMSQYYYWELDNEAAFNEALSVLKDNPYIYDYFIKQGNGAGYVNVDEISSVKYIKAQRRVIFNLSHSVSFVSKDYNTDYKKAKDEKETITSEFVYCNFATDKDFKKYCEYVKDVLLTRDYE